ncbi:putative RNA-binding protein 46 [Caerostris extrusa]|uniref:RNA-binding protein 46 n=1 Tax=Caerostris extrusa TaxID=172846 RepID=A0AAV4PUT4_CAEEX|nr:putative RNA-binding protein 46 [Caerostris extrusa]
MRDFAFIHYSKREDAENALQQFDGVTVDGCALEVTWAKPPETQKQRSLMKKRCHYLLQNAASGFSMLPRGNIRSRLPLSTFSNLKSPFTITRPIQLLNYICLENGWGNLNTIYRVSNLNHPSYFSYAGF